MTRFAQGSPTKDFFISMITKDISLIDCILDLLDNSIDGARRASGKKSRANIFVGRHAKIAFNTNRFSIIDNCGGISIHDAEDYAFHFGRRRGEVGDHPVSGSIGLYGIGMKRAIFKIGRSIEVLSSTGSEAFRVPIDVAKWAAGERPARGERTQSQEPRSDWDFPLYEVSTFTPAGTSIIVKDLNRGIGEEFKGKAFESQLVTTISRDYSFFLRDGFKIEVNNVAVKPYPFSLLVGGEFAPARILYEDQGVSVEIFAGLSDYPPDDLAPESGSRGSGKKTDYFGWFIACNDRIVLAGDKSDQTVWGNEGFQRWHYQYNGFLGIVRFNSQDPSFLPWITTKRGIDLASPLYRRAIVEMKKLTQSFIEYTTAKKGDVNRAQELEKATHAVPIDDLSHQRILKVPSITKAKRVVMTSISYSVPRNQALRVASALGDETMSAKKIGERTFEYYRTHEVLD